MGTSASFEARSAPSLYSTASGSMPARLPAAPAPRDAHKSGEAEPEEKKGRGFGRGSRPARGDVVDVPDVLAIRLGIAVGDAPGELRLAEPGRIDDSEEVRVPIRQQEVRARARDA